MAPRVGQALREARTQRGIALNDVERATGIRVQYLRALEEGNWDRIPEGEARGLVSTYAHHLGLDEGALLEEYERSRQRTSRPGPLPAGVLRPVGISREHHRRRLAVLGAGLVTAVLLGVVLVAALGSDGGGSDGKSPGANEKPEPQQSTTSPTAQSTTTATEATVELSATADVWVCLAEAGGSEPVNGETLTSGESRGPFTSRRFEMTLGNGSIELSVNGDPVKVPPLAVPLGFRITPEGTKRLAPGSGPSCS